MFIDRLNDKDKALLSLILINNKNAPIISFDELEVVNCEDNKFAFRSKSRIPYSQYIEFDDFNAKYELASGFSLPDPKNQIDKSYDLRCFLYVIFGKEYLTALKRHLEDEKNKQVKELKNKLEKEIKQTIDELTK